MKKFLLSFLALIAMVGMVNAQRAWAYDLQLTSAESSYTFAFKATTAGTATLVFTDAVGAEVGTVDLGAVEAGANTKTLALAEIPGIGNLNWAVKMTGAAIEEATLITSCDGFYMPFGVAVNNNPESKHFGKTYVSNPWHEGKKAATGFYVFDQELNLDATLFEGGSKVGYKPSNVELANTRYAIQRMAVSPVDGTIAFAQWETQPYIVYGMNPDALGGDAVALTDNAVLNQPVAVCYDKEGSLCLMNFEGKIDDKYAFSIRVIKDGEVTTFVTNNNWASASGDNDLVSDGHGGFWVLNGKHDVSVGLLRHFTKSGEIDVDITQGTEGYPTAFRRVRIAYDLRRDILAIGGEGKIYLYNVEYDEEGKATLTKWMETPMYNSGKPAWNTDGIAFDYAGDLCAVSASSETFYKFALPTAENTCTTPAPKAQVVVKVEPVTTYTISVTAENGSVEGLENEGVYEEGASVILTATAANGYEFVNWTVGDEEVSTENPYTFVVNADVALVANFQEVVVEPEYDVMDITMTNLVVEEMEDFVVLTASDDENTGLNVMLAVNEDGSLAADSYMALLQGWNKTELPIVEGAITKTFNEELATDVYTGLIVVEYMEGKLGLNLTMYAKPVVVTDVVVTDATITVETGDDGMGGTYESINVSANWNESVLKLEGIEKEFEGFLQITETFVVDGEEDWYIWMCMNGVITTVDNVLTITGEFKNNWTGDVYNVTISGTLPADEPVEPEVPTALDNIDATVAPVKAIVNGQLVIIKNGVQYNAQGAVVK